MVSQDLLEILRCPNCVRNGPEAGLLDYRGNWLICRDCSRKYPVRDGIPVMLIEEGTRFQAIPIEELPDIPPPEEKVSLPPAPALAEAPQQDRFKLIVTLLGAALGIGLIMLLILWLKKKNE